MKRMDVGSKPARGSHMTSNELEDICNRLTDEKYNRLFLDAFGEENWHHINGDWDFRAVYPDYFQIWLDTWHQLQLEYADVVRPVSSRERKKRTYHERYAKACKFAS